MKSFSAKQKCAVHIVQSCSLRVVRCVASAAADDDDDDHDGEGIRE